MTESQTQTESPPAKNGEAPKLPAGVSPEFFSTLVGTATTEANQYNQLTDEIANIGDRVALKDKLLENPEQANDEELTSLVREYNRLSDALEEIAKKRDEKAEPYILNALKRSGVEEKQARADEHAKHVKSFVVFIQSMGGDVSSIPTLKGSRSRTTSGDGRGSGVPKYRNLRVYVDGQLAAQKVPVKKEGVVIGHEVKSNLTYGAAAASVPTDVFRKLFTDAQGTTDPANFKDRVEFKVTDATGKVHEVSVSKDNS